MTVLKMLRRVVLLALVAGLASACATTRASGPIYVVRVDKGDTLAGIAQKYDTTWREIAALNDLEDGFSLKAGDVVRVRPGPGGYAAGVTAKKSSGRAATAARSKRRPTTAARSGGLFAPSAEPAPDADNQMFEEAARTQSGAPAASPATRSRRGGFFTTGDDQTSVRTGGDGIRWPLIGQISSYYGRRGHRLHAGIDIRAKYGTPVAAAAAGHVEFAGRKHGYGRIVILRHRSTKTAYAHLSSIAVDVGDDIEAGQELGAVGTSGNASGPHLHFEVRKLSDGTIDPIAVLPRNRLVSSL